MIPISHPKIDNLVDEHYDAIVEYYKRDNIKTPKSDIKYINDWLLKIINKDFEYVIKATPEQLENLLNNFKSFAQYPYYIERLVNMYKAFASSSKRLRNKNEEDYNAYKLIQKLEITVCPYCNRNFIHNIEKKRTKKIRTSEMDHFYPVSKYPFLAVSFYNLIPSCKVCNKLKLDDETKIINPYDKRYNGNKSVKFSHKITGVEFYNKPEQIKLEIEYKSKKSKENELFEKSFEVFKLNELYENHKDIIVELIKKQHMYSEEYLETLYKQYEGTLFKNFEHLKGIIFGNYISDDEINKRPLAKFTKDILTDLE